MLDKIMEITAEQLQVNKEELKPETDFKKDLQADSLDLFELISELESEYDIEIETEELEQLTTIQAVADYLTKKGITE